MLHSKQGRFFRLVCHLLKYFLLASAGFTIATIISHVLLDSTISSLLMSLIPLFGRVAIVIGCLLALAIVFESIRY